MNKCIIGLMCDKFPKIKNCGQVFDMLFESTEIVTKIGSNTTRLSTMMTMIKISSMIMKIIKMSMMTKEIVDQVPNSND